MPAARPPRGRARRVVAVHPSLAVYPFVNLPLDRLDRLFLRSVSWGVWPSGRCSVGHAEAVSPDGGPTKGFYGAYALPVLRKEPRD